MQASAGPLADRATPEPPAAGAGRLLAAAATVAMLTAPALVIAVPAELIGQTSALFLDAGVSHTLSPGEALIDESSSYGLVGARFDAPLSAGSLLFVSAYAGLTPDEQVGSWLSGSAGAVLIFPFGSRVDLGASIWGGAFTVGGAFPYNGLNGRVAPELRLYFGGWSFALRGTAGLGRTNTTFSRESRSLTLAENQWSYGGGAEIGRVAARASAFLGAELAESWNGRYAWSYARAHIRAGRVDTRLELGVWDTPRGFEPSGRVVISVPLGRGFRTEFYGGRSAPDPLLATPPSADFGAILSWQVAGIKASNSPIVRLDGSDAVFTLNAPDAMKAFVVGDFTLWIPTEMERADGGTWEVRLEVDPGRYEFGFIVDGEWFVPAEAGDVVIDEWGQPNAVLVVPESR